MFKTIHKKTQALFALGLSVSACIPAGDGVPAPAHKIYFPVGLEVSQSGHILIVNSDFDLQFSQGTVQSLDLKRVREVTQVPCNATSNCADGQRCDSKPTADNNNVASYVCVDENAQGPCGPFGEKSTSERAISPGRCGPVDLVEPQDGGSSLLVDVAKTAAFATEGLLLKRPCTDDDGQSSRPCLASDDASALVPQRTGQAHPERLFIPVRGDTTIHYVDIDKDGHFVCGRPIESEDAPEIHFTKTADGKNDYRLRCSAKDYRLDRGKTYGLDQDGNLVNADEPPLPGDLDKDELREIDDEPRNEFRLQPEPIDLAASDGGRFIAISHQVGGMVSTVMNNWLDPPELVHVLRDLSNNPLGIAAIPRVPALGASAAEAESSWDYLLTFRSDPRVDLLHFDDDGLLKGAYDAAAAEGGKAVSVFRPALSLIDSTGITTNSSGTHSRGLAIDDRNRSAEIAACAGDRECEAKAAESPLQVYVTNRSPSSLVVGRTGGESRLAQASLLPRFFDTIPLSAGPSRVVLGSVIGPDGSFLERVFIICFDADLIYVFDPERAVIESELRTGQGPYSLAFDYETGVMYVGHFTDSYVGVISIDQRYPFTYGATLATLGTPDGPRADK